MQQLGPDALAGASATMRAINEAYATLSNARARQEYDAILRGGPAGLPEVSPPQAAAPVATVRRRQVQARPGSELLSSVVGVFSNQLRSDLLAKVAELKWRNREMEGFHWAMCSSSWTSEYIVASRGFAVADLEAASKFANYCDLAIASNKRAMKQSYFLFFFPFQKSSNTEVIAAALRRFCGNSEQQRTPGPAMIVLADAVRGKALVCGPPVRNRRYEHILEALRLSRNEQH
jgi:curved DNA-binding protein CbpA